MRLRSRALALTVALGLAGLSLAGCATDSVPSGASPELGFSYYDSDPLYWSYDHDFWPYYGLGWRGGRADFHHGFGGFHGGPFGGHR